MFVVSAAPENVEASAWGTGVEATTLNNRERRKLEKGEPLGFWSTMGVAPKGEIKTDEELLEAAFAKKTVFLLFRQPKTDSNPKPRTLGLARMTGVRGHPYQRPYDDWPRKTSFTSKQLGPWMKVIPFSVEWYLTCDLQDTDLEFFHSNLPSHFTRQDPAAIPVVLKKLYAECKSNDTQLKKDKRLRVKMDNLREFDKQAQKFNFAPTDLWAGKEIVRPKKATH